MDKALLLAARPEFGNFKEEINRARRGGTNLSVVLLDVDYFKNYNDTYGHLMGDRALTIIGATFRRIARATDIAARYGGEEFSILLIEVGARRAELVANRLCHAIAEAPVGTDAGPLDVTISIGVSELVSTDTSLAQVLARADEALYEAKAGGRNRARTAISNITKIKA